MKCILTLGLSLLSLSRLSAAEYTIKQLTNNTYGDTSPQIHNGQVAWGGSINAYYTPQIFFYDGKQTIQLTNSPYYNTEHQIHNGQVVWSGYDGADSEIFFYDGKQTLQLTNNNYTDRSPQIHNGQIVWYGYSGNDSEIFFYDGSRVIQLTDNDYNDSNPQIYNGQIVWEGPGGITFYDGSQTIQLGSGLSPQIHNGQIVWSGWDGNDLEIFFYDGRQIIQLSDNDYWDGDPQIDNGQVVWGTSRVGPIPGTGFERYIREVFLYDGSKTINLTPEGSAYPTNPQIHNGMVTWQAAIQFGSYNQEIFLYDGRQTIQLTNNYGSDYFPQIHNGQVVWSGPASDGGNDGEIFLAWQPALEILDGVDFSSGREVSSDPEKIVSINGVEAEGAVTDGVTRLLLKLEVDEPNAVNFSLEGTGNPKEDGFLRSLDGSQEGNAITVNSVNTSQGEKAFAVYQAPESFVRPNYIEDKQASERAILLKVKSNGSSSFELSREIKLVRPPVILIHGLWAGPEMWWKNGFAFALASEWPGIWIFRVDYESNNAEEFDVNKNKIKDMIERVREQYRSEEYSPKRIAMVQADVLGHSMGGLLARIYAAGEEYYGKGWYLNDKNFKEGSINKLITLDSPHYGSFLADAAINCLRGEYSVIASAMFWAAEKTGHSFTKGAVDDLMTTSQPIVQMNAKKITTPVHAVAGEYIGASLAYYRDQDGTLKFVIEGIPSDYFDVHNTLIDEGYGNIIIPVVINAGSDLVVSVYSQKGNLDLSSTDTFNHHHIAAATQDVANRVIELLNADMDSNLFNSGFPVNK